MSIEKLIILWYGISFIIIAIIAVYGFVKIAGDGKSSIRSLGAFIWIITLAFWYVVSLMLTARILEQL